MCYLCVLVQEHAMEPNNQVMIHICYYGDAASTAVVNHCPPLKRTEIRNSVSINDGLLLIH